MSTPFSPLRPLRRHKLVSIALFAALTMGCQTPQFLASKQNEQDPPVSLASDSSADDAGLPEPTNAGLSNGPLSLDTVDDQLRIGERELEQGNFAKAQIHFDDVLEEHPQHAKAHHRLGVLADKLGQFSQAEQHYQTALKSDPQNAALLSDLGYSYFMQGRHSDSERYLLEARRIDPNYRTAVANLGLLYASMGRKQEAVAMFRQIGDDAQVESILQQITGGEMGPQQTLADNRGATQQSHVVTTQTSVQSTTPVPAQEMNEATQQFVQQLRDARSHLQQAEQSPPPQQPLTNAQALPHQNWPQPAIVQQTAPGHPSPQSAGVAPHSQGQGSHQPHGQFPQHALPGHIPDSALADRLAEIDRRGQQPRRQTPMIIGQPWPSPETMAATADSGVADGVQAGLQQPSAISSGATGRDVIASPHGQPVVPPTQQGHPHARAGMVPHQGIIVQPGSGYTQAANESAWARQFDRTVEQHQQVETTSPYYNADPNTAGIRQLAATPSDLQPQAIEHAHHTQQPGWRQDIVLAGQQGAANPSLVPPSLHSNWGQQSQATPPLPTETQPAMAQPASPDSASAYEQARRKAALLGLGAGPGQVFPYVQQTPRAMPGTDSRLNGAQYAAPMRHMPSGLTPHHPHTSAGVNAATPVHHRNVPSQIPMATASHAHRQGHPLSPSQALHHQVGQPAQPTMARQQQPADPYAATRTRQSAQLNGLVNETWGQSPQSPPYGVTPPPATPNHEATRNAAATNPVQPAPYESAPQRNHYPVTQTGYYEPSAAANSHLSQPAANGVVVPDQYRPVPHSSPYGQTPSGSVQPAHQSGSHPSSYGRPVIVPGTR